ncbi:uncharacterized protein MKK02DRAFT_29912 [Dioszegia hungarica]|uniref:Uncharacterized protein n=1 Tax=Dioszegia hungarica TaxID=4972 RepID=A0AA38H1K8_9TREE|nr:uncharacterized protein MKK02DRAFT_29912 [Dioszegia hungarica]KAI9632912.1 hypothetical protein MKK02DRAFT_29912 [Dioszegia hungarica]
MPDGRGRGNGVLRPSPSSPLRVHSQAITGCWKRPIGPPHDPAGGKKCHTQRIGCSLYVALPRRILTNAAPLAEHDTRRPQPAAEALDLESLRQSPVLYQAQQPRFNPVFNLSYHIAIATRDSTLPHHTQPGNLHLYQRIQTGPGSSPCDFKVNGLEISILDEKIVIGGRAYPIVPGENTVTKSSDGTLSVNGMDGAAGSKSTESTNLWSLFSWVTRCR